MKLKRNARMKIFRCASISFGAAKEKSHFRCVCVIMMLEEDTSEGGREWRQALISEP